MHQIVTLLPQLLSTSRAAYNRTNLSSDVAVNINYPKNLFFVGSKYPPILSFPGVNNFGPNAQSVSLRIQNLYEFSENLIYSTGVHSMKFGANFEKVGFNTGGPGAGAYGSFGWRTLPEFLQDAPLQIFSAQVGTGTDRSMRQRVLGLYFQEDWQVRPHLTLNLGLRYEPFTPPKEKWDRISVVKDWVHATAFDINVPFWKDPSKKDFSPRVGIAWDPRGNGKTAIRAGFGMFYEVLLGSYYRSISIKNPPFVASIEAPQPNQNLASSASVVQAIGPTLLTPKMTPNTFMEFHQWDLDPTYEMKFNASIEREIASNLSLSVGYIGSRGIHLWRLADANAALPSVVNGRTFVAAGSRRPNPNTGVGTIRYSDAQSFYNAMILEVKKRISRGFQFQSSYTWSRNVDDSTTGVALTDYNEGATSQPYNPKADRGLSSLHLAHNLVINGIWSLPSPAHSGVAGYLLGGWQLSGIFSASSGTPFTVYVSGFNAPDLTRTQGRQHPDLLPGRSGASIVSGTSSGCSTVKSGQKLGTPDLYFDPCAFENQARQMQFGLKLIF